MECNETLEAETDEDDDVTPQILLQGENEPIPREADDQEPEIDDMSLSDSDFEDDDVTASDGRSSPWKKWSQGDEMPSLNQHFQFIEEPGYRPPVDHMPIKELDFFILLFSEEIMKSVIDETNRNADIRKMQNMPFTKSSTWRYWKPLTVETFKAFLGVIIAMALNPKTCLEDYFTNDWVSNQPFFKQIFSRNYFMLVYWNLQIAGRSPESAMSQRTKSYKVRDFLKKLETNFMEYYTPNQVISIEECTIGFKGRVSFRVYNKDKPQKWGIKVYAMADAKNGYVTSMEPYFGRHTTDLLLYPDLPVTARVVLTLSNKLKDYPQQGIGYHIYVDRFYSSIILADEMSKNQFYVTDTVMSNRQRLPQDVKKKSKMVPGQLTPLQRFSHLCMSEV